MKLAVFDIGGTAVKYGFWDGQKITDAAEFPTPATFEEMIIQLKQVVDSMPKVAGAAFSAPGAVNVAARRIDGISAVPYLHGRPIFDELEKALGLPVTIENDANCAGICEIALGAGKEATNAVFLVLGTGVGGAIFINRHIYKGAHLFGGEFGLMKSQRPQIFSATGTLVKAAQFYEEQTGRTVTGKELFLLAEQGDKIASNLIASMYDQIADHLYNIQVAIDPDTVILGGGVSAREELVEAVATRLQQRLTEEGVGEVMPTLRRCEFLNGANLMGAAVNFERIKS